MTAATCALHPDRAAFTTCARCGNFTCTECNPDGRSKCPTCAQLEGAGARGKVPWERRDELGLPSAFWQQLKETLTQPSRFWKTVQPEGRAGEAFWFAWAVSIVAAIGAAPYQAFNLWSQAKQMEDVSQQLGTSAAALQGFFDLMRWLGTHPVQAAFGYAAYAIFAFPIFFAVHVGVVHLGTIIFGLRKNSFAATVRAVGYGSAANILLVIPVVGGFGGIYTLVLQIWGLREVHEGTTGKAVLASLWFTLLIMCVGCAVGVAAVTMLVGSQR